MERDIDRAHAVRYDVNAGWSSLVARWAHNPKVGGSNPPPATNQISRLRASGVNPKTILDHISDSFTLFLAGRNGYSQRLTNESSRPAEIFSLRPTNRFRPASNHPAEIPSGL